MEVPTHGLCCSCRWTRVLLTSWAVQGHLSGVVPVVPFILIACLHLHDCNTAASVNGEWLARKAYLIRKQLKPWLILVGRC